MKDFKKYINRRSGKIIEALQWWSPSDYPTINFRSGWKYPAEFWEEHKDLCCRHCLQKARFHGDVFNRRRALGEDVKSSEICPGSWVCQEDNDSEIFCIKDKEFKKEFKLFHESKAI